MKSKNSLIIATLVLSISSDSPCFADVYYEDTRLPDVFENQSSGIDVSTILFSGVSVPGNSDLDLSVERYSLSGSNSFSVAKGKLNFGALYSSSIYKFGLGDRTNAQSIGFAGIYSQMIGNNWASYVNFWTGSSADDDADFGDGIFGGAGIGFQREWDNGFSLGIGVAGEPEALERNASLSIVPQLKWRLNERARIELGTSTGLTFTYDLSGERMTFLEFALQREGNTFRLEDFAFENVTDVTLFEAATVGVLKLHHRFENGFNITASAGLSDDREFEYYRNGDKIGSFEADGGAFYGLTFGMRY